MGGAGTEHGVTFTSEVEGSKRRAGSGDQGGGPGPASGRVEVRGGGRGGWVDLRAGPRPLPQASSDSRHHPGRQWRSPGRW